MASEVLFEILPDHLSIDESFPFLAMAFEESGCGIFLEFLLVGLVSGKRHG